MKEGWSLKSVKDVSLVIAGQSPEGRYYNADKVGLPFYQGKKEFGEKYIKSSGVWTSVITKTAIAGDILMSVRAPVGPVNVSTEEICIGRGLAAIRQKDNVIHDFLFYFFKYYEGNIKGNTGAVFDSINKAQIENIPFLIPPLPEQQRIVSIIDEAFEAIDKTIENTQKNLQNTKELFENYLQSTFIEKVHGVKFETLESLCELIVDCEHKTAPPQETGYPSIRTPNIGHGELILENVNRVSYENYLQWTKRATPKAGDLILAREAPAGNIAVIPENVDVCLGQRTVLLRLKKDRLISKYLAYLILSKDVQEKLLSHSTGSTVQHINMKDIRAFKIYNLSNLKEQFTVVEKIDILKFKTKKLLVIYQQKIRDLEELKKSLLNKAFAGEL